ncbi:MAG: lamin tail domain-containing protein [Candidatus Cloacimonetes bacterium]|nr:lamin tail domain-containing protein [Candidatus Cloacimonadota bacterium]MCF7868669.1 lamin tail domain-containing protein [Candidatus Cloacimonadota bacterium]
MNKLILVLLVVFASQLLFAQASELFISEYIEGSSYNKAIEIFNGTGSDVDLSEYSLEKDANGAGSWSSSYDYSGTLADGEVFVLANSQADPTILNVADDTDDGVINFNGNDAVRLLKNGTPIDMFGDLSGNDFAANVTLVRNPDVASPVTTWNPDEWTEYPQNTFTYLGTHIFQTNDPMIIVNVPNGGEEWEQASTHTIQWTSLNFTDNVKIELEMVYQRDREVLVASTENDGEWEWNIPVDQLVSDYYVITISDAADGDPIDSSDNPFSIIEPLVIPEYSIYDIQYSTTGPSPLVGELIRTTGVVTAVYPNYFFIQDGPGAWNGIAIYPLQAVEVGDEVDIAAYVAEYNDKTELTDIYDFSVIGTANLPEAVAVQTGDLAVAEEFEGVLVKALNATVTAEPNNYDEWEIDDSSGACVVGAQGTYTYVAVLDDLIYSIKGVLDYAYGSFKLEPRDDNDISLQGLVVDPLELNFISTDDCINGLEFTISNLSNTAFTINSIEDNGEFSSMNPWEIENFSLPLPYSIEAAEELTFNVIVGLPVDGSREIVTDFLNIETNVGNFEITLNFDTNLNVGTQNIILSANKLIGNYPNPFNPTTTIFFELAQNSEVQLTIYNMLGQKITTLVDENFEAGQKQAVWNGTDREGKKVTSGIYFYELHVKDTDYTSTKKMLLLK